MAELNDLLGAHVADGSVPGAVGLIDREGRTEVTAVGSLAIGGAPISPSISA